MDCGRRARPNQALVQTIHTDAGNQLTTISRSGTFTFSGNLPATAASISVNGASAQTNGDFTFAKTGLTLADGNNTFTVSAQNRLGVTTSSTLTLNLPGTVSYTYDQNGNLLTDGTRSFKWDAADQLVQVSVPNAWQTQFARDGLGRLRVLREFTWLNGAWSQTKEIHYLYDGNLIVQERDANNNVMATYTRGLDLSGGLSGAGGIGGLLSRTAGANSYYYHADGAGNITAMLDGNENVVARYLYDPFGRVLGQWGALAFSNPMQFSSMPRAPASGLSLYPFRAYDPALQRWLSRDPLGEAGGINQYGFVGNSPLNAIDSDGQFPQLILGLAIGAIAGGGFSIASDLWNHRDIDWLQAATSATEGAIAGGVAALTFGATLPASLEALAARGALSGLAGDLAAQGAGLAAGTRKCFSENEAFNSAVLGAALPVVGRQISEIFSTPQASSAVEARVGITDLGHQDIVIGMTKDGTILKQVLQPDNYNLAWSHELIAKQIGVWQAGGTLPEGVEAFTVVSENGKIFITGSGNFNPQVSQATEDFLRSLFRAR